MAFFSESITIRLRKEEYNRLKYHIEAFNRDLPEDEQLTISDQVRIWIMQLTEDRGDWRMVYHEDKKNAINEIDRMLADGKSLEEITFLIEKRYGFGERLVKQREALIVKLEKQREAAQKNLGSGEDES